MNYGYNPPDAIQILDLYGVNLPDSQKEIKDVISCVLLHIERLRSGKFCKTCQGRGYRVVDKPFPIENGYSPLTTHPCRETCYACKGDCYDHSRVREGGGG
jgi:hypothetical protein